MNKAYKQIFAAWKIISGHIYIFGIHGTAGEIAFEFKFIRYYGQDIWKTCGWGRAYPYTHFTFLLVHTYECICLPKNIAFSNQLNFNLHNFLYVKVMCSEFDYFPLNWAEDITSGLKVDKADDPRSSPSPVPEKTGASTHSSPSHAQTRSVGQATGYVNMLTAKWVCHGVDKHYCRIYLYLNLCVGRWQG